MQGKHAIFMKEDLSVFAFSHDHAQRAPFPEFSSGQNDVRLPGQLLGFRIIDHEQADFLDQGEQGFALDSDPQVDGVCQDEGIALQLVEQAVGAARPFRAVVADSFYGEHEAFKAGLETLSIGYVLALKPSHCWWHLEGTIGSVFDAAQAADWQADAPGDWVALQRVFRDGHEETWWALEADAGPYGPERAQRLVIVTTDPTQLPDQSTWYLTTNVPTPDSARAATRPLTAADLAEVVRLYGLRIWVEQSYKQVKGTLGWADYQVRNAVGIRRHWQLVWCAFSFCWWALDQEDIQPIESVLDTGLSPIQVEAVRAPHLSSANANQREKKTMRWRPRLRWPQALRKVRAWLEPYLKLRLYWQAGSKDPPPAPLQALLDRLEKGQPIYLYCR